MAVIERSFVMVKGLPTKLVTLGSKVQEKPRKLILVIPGNPGLASFYEDFMLHLKSKLPGDYSIWTLAHTGQELSPNLPVLSEHPDLYNLEAQIQYKVDFIRENIDTREQELVLMGHSIGAKMVMDVMKNDPHIRLGCLLFPTIEHMKESPAGKRGWIAMHYIPKVVTFLAWVLSLLPRSLLSTLVNFWMKDKHLSPACLDTTVDLLNKVTIENMLHLAHTELETVIEPDYALITELSPRLRFYYGTVDDWVPLSYYENLLKNVPNVQAEKCQLKIPHAFVLSHSEPVADVVSSWLNKSKKQ